MQSEIWSIIFFLFLTVRRTSTESTSFYAKKYGITGLTSEYEILYAELNEKAEAATSALEVR